MRHDTYHARVIAYTVGWRHVLSLPDITPEAARRWLRAFELAPSGSSVEACAMGCLDAMEARESLA